MKLGITDTKGRTFKTLRVSLLPFCNLSCIYCVNGKQSETDFSDKPLRYTELASIIEILHHTLHLSKIRLTGGEPTLYHELVPLMNVLSQTVDVPLYLTTNGLRLNALLSSFKTTRLKGINVSLDAMSEDVFRKVSGRAGWNSVCSAVENAVREGFEVKLNSVILKGVNEQEIIPLTEFARRMGISIRFLELMRMGHLFSEQFDAFYFSREEILASLSEVYTLSPELRKSSATAEYWQLEQGGKVGIIANESTPFCSDCDRLRLDSFGKIYGCLSSNEAISIHDALHDQDALKRRLAQALEQKQDYGFVGSELSMLKIGG